MLPAVGVPPPRLSEDIGGFPDFERCLTVPTCGHKILVMAKPRMGTTRLRHRQGTSGADVLAAAEFKARCLELMERVRETGVEYVVTKHGVPVAKLVPYRAPKRVASFGSMKGTVLKYERPLDPIDGEYDINRE
jgi:prevent-host-death family protein